MATREKNKAGGRAVVLLSGGMDSAVAGAVAREQGREIYALGLLYGQRHRRELEAARWQAQRLGARRFEILKLPLSSIASGSLLQGGPNSQPRAVPRGAPSRGAKSRGAKSTGIPPTYVTFRNGVFLALALSFAEAVGADEVWGGWCRTDHDGYPDCRPPFFKAMEHAARLGTKAGAQEGRAFKIVAPLSGLSKAQTITWGRELGVDFAHTWTCYQGAARPCGRCDACKLRQEGFEEARIEDPLKGKR